MRPSRPFALVLALAGLTACSGEEEPVPQDPTVARADSVAMAEARFDPAVFDTLDWSAQPQTALERGSLVYRISCSKCHGEVGRGDGGFVFQGDTLRPPSFLGADWRFADDPEGLRRYIYSGNVLGMPYWGLVGLQYRDIDAVATYIDQVLRESYPETP